MTYGRSFSNVVSSYSEEYLTIKHVLLIYDSLNNDGAPYVEIGTVHNGAIAELTPLKRSVARQLFQATLDSPSTLNGRALFERQFLGINTSNAVLKFMWVCPARMQNIFVNDISLEVKAPNMLFYYRNENLYTCMVKENPVTINTKLFESPFSNTSGSMGKVCLGSNRISWNMNKDTMYNVEDIERTFWNSSFSAKPKEIKLCKQLSMTISKLWGF